MGKRRSGRKYQIKNRRSVQGQNVGDHNTNMQNYITTQHNFYSSRDELVPTNPPEHVRNVPFPRNPFFTGREDILNNLHDVLTADKTVALTQAISGLGGIGKTQTAVEYAYRYGSEYKAVLWVKADSQEILISEFVSIAHLLNLPQKNEQDQNEVVEAVKRWLQSQADWLLILDNVEAIDTVNKFLPQSWRGHILLTTRLQAIGTLTAHHIEIKKMEIEEGALFLLRRAKFIPPEALLAQASDTDQTIAKEISAEMDGLPLALDQAAAFIEETQSSLSEYLNLYRERKPELLKDRGNSPDASGHPESVTTTFLLSFEKVAHANPASANILRLCAFLHYDDIPEELLAQSTSIFASGTVDQIALKRALSELFKYSLLHRNPDTKTLTIHRLVQVVLIDGMGKDTQRVWAEYAVKSVNRAFPNINKIWSECQPYLPHLQACILLIEQWNMNSDDTAGLLIVAGVYLQTLAQYTQATIFYEKAQTIFEKLSEDQSKTDDNKQAQIFVSRALLMADNFYNRATLASEIGEYEQAQRFFSAALEVVEKLLGPEHPRLLLILTGLAGLCHRQSKYDEAEALYQRALTIKENVEKPEDLETSALLASLAYLHKDQGKYVQADELYQRAQTIFERELGHDDPSIAKLLHNRARSYLEQGKYAQAEPLFKQALQMSETIWGREHPDFAQTSNHLGDLYRIQNRYGQAEHYLQRALKIQEKIWGPAHPDTANTLNHLGLLYEARGEHAKAEQLYLRALAMEEEIFGSENIHVAVVLVNLSDVYTRQGARAKAEPLLQRAYTMLKRLTPGHPNTINCLNKLYHIYIQQNKQDQAKLLLQQERSIIAKALEADVGSDIAAALNTDLTVVLLQDALSTNPTTEQRSKQKKRLDKNQVQRWLM